jgi:hypothetical protein
MQDRADVASEAREVQASQPCSTVHVADGLVKDWFLVIEKKVIANVWVLQALMLILFHPSMHLMYITNLGVATSTCY